MGVGPVNDGTVVLEAKPSVDPKRILSVGAAIAMVVLATALLSVAGRTETDLSAAVADGNHGLVRVLLEQGADPDLPVVKGFTPVMRAGIRNDAKMVRLLAEAGADVNATSSSGGMTALHSAALVDSVDALEELIGAGAEITARSANGYNALDHAAASGSIRTIALLTEAGLDPDGKSQGFINIPGFPSDAGPTPLALAANAGHLAAVQALLGLGAEVDGPSERGQTPLLQAVATKQPPEMVSLLLSAGADPTVVSMCVSGCARSDTDVLGWARRLGKEDVVSLLEDHLGTELTAADQPTG